MLKPKNVHALTKDSIYRTQPLATLVQPVAKIAQAVITVDNARLVTLLVQSSTLPIISLRQAVWVATEAAMNVMIWQLAKLACPLLKSTMVKCVDAL